jgi:hypothetical protein
LASHWLILMSLLCAELCVGFTDDWEANHYGCFVSRHCSSSQLGVLAASRCKDIAGGIALVMLIVPELQELCRESSTSPSMVYLEVDSLGPSAVACATIPELIKSLSFVDWFSLQKSSLTYSAVWRRLSLDLAKRFCT